MSEYADLVFSVFLLSAYLIIFIAILFYNFINLPGYSSCVRHCPNDSEAQYGDVRSTNFGNCIGLKNNNAKTTLILASTFFINATYPLTIANRHNSNFSISTDIPEETNSNTPQSIVN